MTYDDYDITDNGDGTFTLTPKTLPNADHDEIRREYRAIRDQIVTMRDHRDQVVAKIQALVLRRDELKALLLTYGDPDAE